jgi:N6-L-threonylcarbamoyladenine synthase
MPSLVVLGIETSCDETAASVVRLGADGAVDVLSDVVWSQIEAHAPYLGVVPEIAARAHVEKIDHAIAAAMGEAGLEFAALDGVAATAGPGLIGGVMVGLLAGKGPRPGPPASCPCRLPRRPWRQRQPLASRAESLGAQPPP